eukprot:maker-scaffold366_size194251-snap-gene-0.21 protein:Tk03121 transcript:maker-scaffold366_size194251-snap-gene-0.21-mRNA-1 annotation:"thiopurine s-methyltransferase-like"
MAFMDNVKVHVPLGLSQKLWSPLVVMSFTCLSLTDGPLDIKGSKEYANDFDGLPESDSCAEKICGLFLFAYCSDMVDSQLGLLAAVEEPMHGRLVDEDEQRGRTPWHNAEFHQKLKAHLGLFPQSDEAKRFLVPLCGKSVDLFHLSQTCHNWTVIGVEIVEKGCHDFFQEQNIEYDSETHSDEGYILFKSKNKRIQMYCGDFFKLTPQILGGTIDYVWDRGSMVAIPPPKRQDYIKTMKALLSPKFVYLLSTVEYDPSVRNGPPHSVPSAEVMKLWDEFGRIKVLENRLEESPGDQMLENLFLIHEQSQDPVQYWQGRWMDDQAPWHSNNPNPFLLKYLDKLKDGRDSMTIFLPLCGKSGDLIFLYREGHSVIGLEGVPYVVESFFKENKLEYSKEVVPAIDGFKYQTPDGRLKIYACDIFKMRPDVIGSVDTIFDRGSFEAILVEDRPRYLDLMAKILAPKFRIILNGYEYDNSVFKGPPRHVDHKVIEEMYGKFSQVEILEQSDDESRAKRFNVDKMTKFVYYITRN